MNDEVIMNRKKIKLSKHKIKKAISLYEECFATNDGPCEGVGLHIYITEDNYVVGLCKSKKCHQGYGGIVHGGIIGTYFDEVLWYATTVSEEELVAMTVEMNIRYLDSIPVEENLRIIAKPMSVKGRHIYVDGYILKEDDTVAAEATAHFIVVKEDHTLNDENVYEKIANQEYKISEEIIF